MSDIFISGSGDDGGGGIGCGGKRKRTEETIDSYNSDTVDADTLHDQLTAAQLELALAIQNVKDKRKKLEDIHEQNRSAGKYKADSLLRLSDGGNEHIFTHIMTYLDIKDIGPCAVVCRTLNNPTKNCCIQTHNYRRVGRRLPLRES